VTTPRRGFLLVAGVVCATPLAAQRDVTARLAGRVPAAVAAAVRVLADSAAARGLPADPLVDKAIEGGAKGVPPERVVAAVRLVLGELDAAAAAIRMGRVAIPDGETIEAGAFALAAGMTGPQVTELVRLSTDSYAPAATLRVAGTLTALGVPAPQTVELIRETIRSGGSGADLLALPARLQSRVARGANPAQAAAGLARADAARAAAPGQGKPDKGPPPRNPRQP
jgi:hypothetical protein